jgi:cardiolipin synthase
MAWLTDVDALLLGALVAAASIAASLHAVLHKRDARAAIAWVAMIALVPGLGALFYALLGVNRIRRRAIALRRGRPQAAVTGEHSHKVAPESVGETHHGLARLARLGFRLSGRPLVHGNRVSPLRDGDEAYPAMLAAIEGATTSVALSSFIFAPDAAGAPFVDALARAVRRGVQVRVLVDGVGVRYAWPPIHLVLRKAGVPVARFLPPLTASGLAFFNLRSHRKLLVVDGAVAFCGGMNIRRFHVLARGDRRATRDVHFRLEGPVVAQLLEAFAEDWAFAAGETLEGPAWQPRVTDVGLTVARAITDGPDIDLDVIRGVFLGALTAARDAITIVTPYFLPDQAMVAALSTAALRGVHVTIILPARSNIPLVTWASRAMLWQVLQPGCRVFLTPKPFDHAKLLVVDGAWALIGSTNWDQRSFRLNFELDVECYDPALAAQLAALAEERRREGHELTLAEVDARPFPVRVRDGVARLFSPYL